MLFFIIEKRIESMFIDRAVIEVRSGKGGDGAIAFLREKYVAKGGPAGGNGGRGGSIFLRASKTINTLFNFRHSKTFIANDGEKGGIKNQYGKYAEDVIIDVPIGTVVYLEKDKEFLGDLNEDGKMIRVAKGGRGGRGNSCFKSSTNRVPKIAENGEPGERHRLILELKLLADVGLLGFPNVGKSTFLSRTTSATPKIANYHFTTLEPNLGVVKLDYGASFIVADIPGIIEGACEGTGLGLQFLRHIERTRLLLHIIDISGIEGRDPVQDFNIINEELKKYSEKLASRKQIIVANKADAMQDNTLYKKLEKMAKEKSIEIYKISAVTGEGIEELLKHVADILKTLPKEDVVEVTGGEKIYTLKDEPEFTITRENGIFVVDGPGVQKIMRRVNLEDNESMYYFQRCLDELGVNKALKKAGVKEGDTVKVVDWELEWYD